MSLIRAQAVTKTHRSSIYSDDIFLEVAAVDDKLGLFFLITATFVLARN